MLVLETSPPELVWLTERDSCLVVERSLTDSVLETGFLCTPMLSTKTQENSLDSGVFDQTTFKLHTKNKGSCLEILIRE